MSKKIEAAATPITEEQEAILKTAEEVIDVSDMVKDFEIKLRAKIPFLYVTTHEEHRFLIEAISYLSNLNSKKKYEFWIWSQYSGLFKYEDSKSLNEIILATGDMKGTENPSKALSKIAELKAAPGKKQIFFMRDMNQILGYPLTRQMRDSQKNFSMNSKSVVIVAPQLTYGAGSGKVHGVEPTLEKEMIVFNYNLPTREQIEDVLKNVVGLVASNPSGAGLVTEYSQEDFYKYSRCLQGLTLHEARWAAICSYHKFKELNKEYLTAEKKQIVSKNGILEYIESKSNMDSIGGMDEAKKYFTNYTACSTEEAAEFGVEPLKGVLFTGIPGTGKSALAKAVGNLWDEPTLRLDVGKVMTGLVGGSEGKMRSVIETAEAMQPCILWIDEIEKALSGTGSSNFSDGGTLARVFGTLLTSMEEGLKGVTIIATANDISKLPPELIRRFNEVFFVDIPTNDERKEIFQIHLAKRKRDTKGLDMQKLSDATEKFTGAEIEKAVKDALAKCFTDGKKPLTTEGLLESIKGTKPIFTVMGEKINELRKWAKNRARYASSKAAAAMVSNSKEMTQALDAVLEELPTAKKKRGVIEATGDDNKIELE
jgi:ATP-dependent 26S proteasome regulatory subunit